MKRIVVLAALFCLPSVVHADQLRVTSYDMDDTGGTVRLESNTAVGEPWVRVDAKAVRVWFPHIVDVARFDHEREGDQPIKALALRPGASDTAVLRVDLGNARHVKPSDVEITRSGPQVSVQIKVPSKAASMAAPEVTQPLKQAVLAAPNTGKHTALAAAEAPPTAAAAGPIAAKGSTTTDISAAKTGLLPGMADMPVDLSKQSPPTLMYLMIASLVLAAILGALQYSNKRKPATKPQIEVLGARRLGHRQELLIVRALGSDHLLLCTAGRAERVASSPTPMPTAPDSFARGEDSQAGGIGLMSRLSSHSRLRKLLDNVDREAPADEEERDLPLTPKQHPFGAELFSAARKQAGIHSLPAPRTRQSEAVAGINRLRKRAAT